MLVTMATPISSHVKDKNSIFTARDEDMIFLVKGKILVFHQYLYNKDHYITTWETRSHFTPGFCGILAECYLKSFLDYFRAPFYRTYIILCGFISRLPEIWRLRILE